MNLKALCVVCSILALSSCMTVPKVLQGEFDPISVKQAQNSQVKMKNVRWSGQIIQVTNDNEKTCFVIVNSETDRYTRPLRVIPKNGGRFIACKKGFLEPKAFEQKLVTVTGKLSSYVSDKIDELDYIYPVISSDIIYIWREARPINFLPPVTLFHNSLYFCRYSHRPVCM